MASQQQQQRQQRQPQVRIVLESSTPRKIQDAWQVVVNAFATEGQKALENREVQFFRDWTPDGAPVTTDQNGRVQHIFNVPFETANAIGNLNVSAQIVGMAARASTSVSLPYQAPRKPAKIEVKADGSEGLYTLHVLVVDENGRGIQAPLRFYSLRGTDDPNTHQPYSDYEDRGTDENGALAFPLEFENPHTMIGIMVLGTDLDTKLELEGPRRALVREIEKQASQEGIFQQGCWAIIKDAWQKAGEENRRRKERRGRR